MSSLKQPKYILFDVGNVLVYKVTHEDENVAKILNLTREKYRSVLDRLIEDQSDSEKREFKGMNTVGKEKEYLDNLHEKICNYLNIDFDKDFIDKMTDYRMKGDFALKEDTAEALELLSKKYVLGIFSNALPSRRTHELRINNIDRYFKHIFISKEIGVEKPDLNSYEYVLSQIGFKTEEIMFVDDKLDYLEGAKAAGIENLVLLKNKEISDKYIMFNNLLELANALIKN